MDPKEAHGADISEHSKQVARGSFWSLVGNIFFKLISFVYVIILARLADPGSVSIFYSALAIVTIINVFSDLGISGAFTRYVPYFEGRGEHGKIKDLLRLSYKYLTVLSIAMTAVLFLSAGLIVDFYKQPELTDAMVPQLTLAIQIMSLYILLGNLFRLNYLYMQSMGDIKGSQFYQNLQNFSKLVLSVIFFYAFGISVAIICYGFILSVFIALALSSVPVYRSVASISAEGRLSRKELLEEVIPLGMLVAVLTSFSAILFNADRLILGKFAFADVGVYSLATTLAAVLMTFPGAVGNIFLPVVSKLSGRGDLDKMKEVIATSQRWTMFITLPIAVVMMAFAADMLRIFYGSAYETGAAVMTIATLGLVFSSFSYAISLALTANRMIRIELIISGVGGAFNLLLCLLLIPSYGMEGAAVAGLLALALTGILLQYYGQKMLGFRQPPGIYKLLLAALITYALILLIKPAAITAFSGIPSAGFGPQIDAYLPKVEYLIYLGVMISVSSALFVPISLLLRCFHREDVGLMRKVLLKAQVPLPLVSLAVRIAETGLEGRK